MNLPNPLFSDLSREMFGVFRLDWTPQELNSRWSQALGWSDKELLNFKFTDLLATEDLQALDIETTALTDQSLMREFTARLRCKDKEYKFLKVAYRLDSPSQLIYLVAKDTVEDDLHRTLARRANRVAKIGNWSFELTTNKVYWSPDLWELFDLDPSLFDVTLESWDLTFERSLDFFPENKELIRKKFMDLIQHRLEYDIEVVATSTKGRVFPARTIGSLYYEEGVPTYAFGLVQDISASKALEDSLRYQRDLLNGIIDSSPSVVYVKDLNGKFLLVNRLVEKLTGLKKEELIGKRTIDEIASPATSKNHSELSARVLSTKAPASCNDTYLTKDGKTLHFLSEQFPLLNEKGEIFALAGISTDITEIRHYQNELLKAKEAAEAGTRVKSEFLANMSHEIRTPMNSISGMADLLLDTDLTEEQRKYLTILNRASESLLKIINDILDLSKIEAGQVNLEIHEYSVRDVVSKAIDFLLVEASRKNLSLRSEIAATVPETALGDPARLQQVLLNLIGNGLKFTDEGHVIVYVDPLPENPQFLRFIVEDTGMGLTPPQKNLIFERFAQADSSITRRFGGTGLGLTISKQLVEQMGGSMELESEVNRGSRFIFTLPIRLETETASN